jgi:hypothetical protein
MAPAENALGASSIGLRPGLLFSSLGFMWGTVAGGGRAGAAAPRPFRRIIQYTHVHYKHGN